MYLDNGSRAPLRGTRCVLLLAQLEIRHEDREILSRHHHLIARLRVDLRRCPVLNKLSVSTRRARIAERRATRRQERRVNRVFPWTAAARYGVERERFDVRRIRALVCSDRAA